VLGEERAVRRKEKHQKRNWKRENRNEDERGMSVDERPVGKRVEGAAGRGYPPVFAYVGETKELAEEKR
jgi:hypothetical protein